LQNRDWGTELRVVKWLKMKEFVRFGFNITLTDAGVAHANEILQLVFEYLFLARNQPASSMLFEDIKKMNLHLDPEDHQEITIAKNISLGHFSGYHDVYAQMLVFDSQKILDCLKKLKVERANVFLRAPLIVGDGGTVSKFGEIPFNREKIPDSVISHCRNIESGRAEPSRSVYLPPKYFSKY
jgi:secreted Zn-dependent insulinase-like peptidase